MSDRFAVFCARLGSGFDPAFVKLHVGTDDLDELVELTWERDDLSPLLEAGMKPLLRNKLYRAILEERAVRQAQHGVSQTVTPGSASPHVTEQATISEASEALTFQEEELSSETNGRDVPTDEVLKQPDSAELGDSEQQSEAKPTVDGQAKHLDSAAVDGSKRQNAPNSSAEEPKEPDLAESGDRERQYDVDFPSLAAPSQKRTVPQAAHTRVSSAGEARAYRDYKQSECKGSTADASRAHDDMLKVSASGGGYGRQFAVGTRSSVGELHGPQAGGRVHFSGCLMWDSTVPQTCSKPYQEDIHSEYVGVGRYPRNDKAFPKAIQSSFDSVAVDAGTRVIIYSEPNFKGKVLWDRVGPAIVVNVKWKTNKWPFTRGKLYSEALAEDWAQPLNSIFPPAVREFSCSDMHTWNSGSVIISGGEAIPSQLDAVKEYGALANPRC